MVYRCAVYGRNVGALRLLALQGEPKKCAYKVARLQRKIGAIVVFLAPRNKFADVNFVKNMGDSRRNDGIAVEIAHRRQTSWQTPLFACGFRPDKLVFIDNAAMQR